MNRDETVALFLECEGKRRDARAAALADGKDEDEAGRMAHEAAKAHWSAWAGPLLAERKAMEADGRWAAEKDDFGSLEPKNARTRAWIERAAADFSRGLFGPLYPPYKKEVAGEEKKGDNGGERPVKSIQLEGSGADFSGFMFPGNASFASATFSGGASFASTTFSGNASFGSTTFSGAARFDSATFSGTASFGSTTFSGYASFGSTTFSGTARFDTAIVLGATWFASATFSGAASFASATFSGGASFDGTTFSGAARFDSATFSGAASFGSTTFSGYAWFASATFSGTARFDSATFQNSTSYRDANFGKEASFTGIKVDRAFDMTGATFKQVPAFNQADFKQAPDLDNVTFPLPFFRGDAKLVAKYRAIRRMAIQGADYEREQMAFKGELRSRRWTVDKWWHWGTWFGLAYDLLADCGRSIVRPVLLWLASVAGFAVLYLQAADQAALKSCGVPFVKALFLSGRNALVLFGGGRDERIAQAYRCLYGGAGSTGGTGSTGGAGARKSPTA